LKKNYNPTGDSGVAIPIEYTVKELDVPEDYEVEETDVSETGAEIKRFIITNTMPEGEAEITKVFLADPEEPIFNPGAINIPVQKTWVDDNNAAGARPGSIRVHLYAGGIRVATETLSAANNWRTIFPDLPIYNEDEEQIVYSIIEEPVPGYISEVNGFEIINTYLPETVSVGVQKIWVDRNNTGNVRPASIRMTLSNGMGVTLNEANNWTAVISGLPAIVNGQPATYTWTEQAIPGYIQTSVQTLGSMTVFTNTLFERPPTPPTPPRVPGRPVIVFEEYETPLGVAVEINHVGDCFD